MHSSNKTLEYICTLSNVRDTVRETLDLPLALKFTGIGKLPAVGLVFSIG